MSSSPTETPEEPRISRRQALAIAAAAITAGAGVVARNNARAAKDITSTLTGDSLGLLMTKADKLARIDASGLPQQAQVALERFRASNPAGYRQLMAKVAEHEHNPRANVLDVLGTGVFVHGILQIIDPNIGHVGQEPYTELAAVLAAKYITGNKQSREHLLHELGENMVMTLAVLVLVTLGENTGVHMDLFQKRIKKALDSDATRAQVSTIESRGKTNIATLQQFAAEFTRVVSTANTITAIQQVRSKVELGGAEQQRIIKWFIEKELWVTLNAAYHQETGKDLPTQQVLKAAPNTLDSAQEAFCKAWLRDNVTQVISRVAGRFDSQDKIRDTIELASGSALFASAASPVVTTVAAASVVRKAGIGSKLSGQPTPGYESGKAVPMAMNGIPPFEYRIKNLLEDHVSNLSGLGGVGDPPFIAMMQKFGLKGFVAQLIATWPATAMNAELSYAGLLQEYYPFLTTMEAHKMATEHFARLVPEYFRLLACNIVNVFCALIGGALSVGASLSKLVTPSTLKKMKSQGLDGLIFSEGPMQRWQKKRAAENKKSNFRLAEGVQFSLGVMAYEVIDELMVTEKPSLESLAALVERLESKLSVAIAANNESAKHTIDIPKEILEGHAKQKNIRELHRHMQEVGELLTSLWAINTDPDRAVVLLASIKSLKEDRAGTNEPDQQDANAVKIHRLTAEMHELIKQRRAVHSTSESKAERERNVATFVMYRDQAKEKIRLISDLAANIEDDQMKRQIRYFTQQANTKLMTLELSQLRLVESFQANPFEAAKTVMGGTFEMEHMKALLGPTRAEVSNTLPFQSGCVPMLRPVFQEGLSLLPESMHALYVVMIFTALNIFSSGADNLVATLVGLGIKESLWPYILQASISGGANSRIGNMANLAGCSMEEFPLKASLCWYFVKKHIFKAGINLGYAAVLDQFVIPHFPILQLKSEDAERHLAALQVERENELTAAHGFRNRLRNVVRKAPDPASEFVAHQRANARNILQKRTLAEEAA